MHHFLVLVILLLPSILQGHQIAEMTLDIESKGDTFQATIQADAAYMLPEYRGDVEVAAQDLAWLRGLPQPEWRRIRLETVKYLENCLSIRNESGPIDWQASFPDFDRNPPTFINEGIPEMPPMLTVQLDGEFTARPFTSVGTSPSESC